MPLLDSGFKHTAKILSLDLRRDCKPSNLLAILVWKVGGVSGTSSAGSVSMGGSDPEFWARISFPLNEKGCLWNWGCDRVGCLCVAWK